MKVIHASSAERKEMTFRNCATAPSVFIGGSIGVGT